MNCRNPHSRPAHTRIIRTGFWNRERCICRHNHQRTTYNSTKLMLLLDYRRLNSSFTQRLQRLEAIAFGTLERLPRNTVHFGFHNLQLLAHSRAHVQYMFMLWCVGGLLSSYTQVPCGPRSEPGILKYTTQWKTDKACNTNH